MDLVGQTHLTQEGLVVDLVAEELLDQLTLIVKELNPVNRELREHTDTEQVVEQEVILTKVQVVVELVMPELLLLLLEMLDLEETEEQLLYQDHLLLILVAAVAVHGMEMHLVDQAVAVLDVLIVLLVQVLMVLAAVVLAADNLKEMELVAEVVS